MLVDDLAQRDQLQNEKASQEAYKNLQHGSFQDVFEQVNKEDDGVITCCICLNDFKGEDQATVLKCDRRHIFHSPCILPALKRKLECPICRKPVDRN